MIHARDDYNRIQDPAKRIGLTEPVFLIRAKDISAPDTVRHWAELNRINGGDPELTKLALEHAKFMEEWQAINGSKPADLAADDIPNVLDPKRMWDNI